jgi:N-acetylglucosamine malate deacetylase 1
MTGDQQNSHRGYGMLVDVLLFGAHPDDVEWGAGGTVLTLRATGTSFGIVDLTRGEMGSRGTSEERDKEAQDAAAWMGARFRENLGLPDCGVIDSVENRQQIASVIRRYRPKLVLAPYWEDRDPNPPHKPLAYLYYLLHHFKHPSLVVDISDVYQSKLELLRIHASQFAKTAEGFGVLPLGMNDYLFGLESRDRFFGSLISVHHGEAFINEVPLKLGSLNDFPSFHK